MTNIQDSKHSSLVTETGDTGNVSDLEMTWLQTITGLSDKGLNDLYNALMDDQSVSEGWINDRLFEWLGVLGHEGDINKRWQLFWEAGGPGLVPAHIIDELGNHLVDELGNHIIGGVI